MTTLIGPTKIDERVAKDQEISAKQKEAEKIIQQMENIGWSKNIAPGIQVKQPVSEYPGSKADYDRQMGVQHVE